MPNVRGSWWFIDILHNHSWMDWISRWCAAISNYIWLMVDSPIWLWVTTLVPLVYHYQPLFSLWVCCLPKKYWWWTDPTRHLAEVAVSSQQFPPGTPSGGIVLPATISSPGSGKALASKKYPAETTFMILYGYLEKNSFIRLMKLFMDMLWSCWWIFLIC